MMGDDQEMYHPGEFWAEWRNRPVWPLAVFLCFTTFHNTLLSELFCLPRAL